MKQKRPHDSPLFNLPGEDQWIPNGKPCPRFVERPESERERQARLPYCHRCGYVRQLHAGEGTGAT